MILEHLDTTKIKTTEWFMIELRSERTSEETIRRIGKELAAIFPSDPVEVFVPLKERDCSTFVLLTDCYLFVRADDPIKVGKIRRVTGVLGILARDESTRPSKFLRVPDDYVQDLIKTCWEQHQQRSAGIAVGSWVRLIDGQMRDFCGYVLGILEGRATVRIAARTKLIIVDTSLQNLKDLSDVPEAARVFYYSEPVTRFLLEHGEEAATALAPDRSFNLEEMAGFFRQHGAEGSSSPASRNSRQPLMSREQTPTRFVESLLEGGERDVTVLLKKTVDAIRAKHLRAPSTATVLWHIIRETIRRTVFESDATVRTYSDIIAHHGSSWALTPKQVLEAIPELPLRPVHDVVVCVEPDPEPTAPMARPSATITSLVRAELGARRFDMWAVIRSAEEMLRAGTLRAPKHLDSIVQAIRTQVLRHFHRDIGAPGGIRALAEAYGQGLHVTTLEARARFPHLEDTLLLRRSEQRRHTSARVLITPVALEPMAPRVLPLPQVSTTVEMIPMGIIPQRAAIRPVTRTSTSLH